QLTAARAFGSTVTDPVVENGRHVRFAATPRQLTATMFGQQLGSWEAPRIAYLQHDTDPVVWWSTDLVLHTPTWLSETRPPDSPMSGMSWLPVVTFCQVTSDLAMANSVPGGYGHRYFESETVPAWAGVLGMDPDGDYSRIQAAIRFANEG
ncbi:MAG: alpha/beta-hydrolase family protein, partial [Lapillicoccus sp.]